MFLYGFRYSDIHIFSFQIFRIKDSGSKIKDPGIQDPGVQNPDIQDLSFLRILLK